MHANSMEEDVRNLRNEATARWKQHVDTIWLYKVRKKA